MYPEIKRRAEAKNAAAKKPAAPKHDDMVRFELMKHFGYYVTESSEHDEYPRRCIANIKNWKRQHAELVNNTALTHTRSHEYGSYIIEAMGTDVPYRIGGNVLNTGLITNLPAKAVVEVPCLVDRNGVQGCYIGALPEPCAALNRTNINVQRLTIEAALTRKKEHIYHAAMLDPHTASELPFDTIRALCDDLIEAHGCMLPKYR